MANDERAKKDKSAVGGADGGTAAVPAASLEVTRDEVMLEFPLAHPLPYPQIGCIQIVSGTGYVLGWAKTEAGAWKESARLIRAMNEDGIC
jgi:hypothetical protein